jgi:CheY-like chemotaxis protein
LPKVFEPFFTTKEIGKGTGLGLSTVYGVVKQHHGGIEVQSEVGKGTVFSICLPIVECQTLAASISTSISPNVAREATILLVEDDQYVLRLARYTLQRAGYCVTEAASGRSALTLVNEKGPFDLLISDIVMPGGLNGADLAKQIMARYPNMPVILTSGYTEYHGKAIEYPSGVTFLQKPYAPDVFLRSVGAALSAAEVNRSESASVSNFSDHMARA